MSGVNEHMDLKLFGREVILEEIQPVIMIPDRHRQTDRQTDESNLITALCASIARLLLL